MDGHEAADGTYAAEVATCTDGLVTFIAPTCDPAVLITRTETLPTTEFTPGESVTITVATGTITRVEPPIE